MTDEWNAWITLRPESKLTLVDACIPDDFLLSQTRISKFQVGLSQLRVDAGLETPRMVIWVSLKLLLPLAGSSWIRAWYVFTVRWTLALAEFLRALVHFSRRNPGQVRQLFLSWITSHSDTGSIADVSTRVLLTNSLTGTDGELSSPRVPQPGGLKITASVTTCHRMSEARRMQGGRRMWQSVDVRGRGSRDAQRSMRLRHSLDSQLSKFTEPSSPVGILCPATILKPSDRGNVRCDPGESKPSNRAYCQLSGASSPSRLVPSNNPTVRERSRSSVLNPCSLPRVRSGPGFPTRVCPHRAEAKAPSGSCLAARVAG